MAESEGLEPPSHEVERRGLTPEHMHSMPVFHPDLIRLSDHEPASTAQPTAPSAERARVRRLQGLRDGSINGHEDAENG